MPLHSDFEIRWKNYRAFGDTEWVKIRPLTILIGPNNSGKTSVISPLLLLDQTMASRDSVTPLVTRGSLADVGSFKNIVHNHDVRREIFFGLRYHVHEAQPRPEKIGDYPPGAIEITLGVGAQPEDVVLRRFEVFDVLRRPFLKLVRDRSGKYVAESKAFQLQRERERLAIRNTKPMNFLFSPASAMSALQRQNKKARGMAETVRFAEPSRAFSMYLNVLSAVLVATNDLLRGLSYVGPLRERPKRYYPIASETPSSVGPCGEHMANLVRKRHAEFRQRLDEWIDKFGFGNRLTVESLSDESFSLCFQDRKKTKTNIADAGFGASQVLPLIVQSLAAEKESITIAEQPEIHLNPRLQYLLADLFAEMANRDRRVIVETHSEHLMLRLRRLIANGSISHRRVAVYYVEKTGGASQIREVKIEENGNIPTWPKGFFEDTLHESLALAIEQSQREDRRAAGGKLSARHGNKG